MFLKFRENGENYYEIRDLLFNNFLKQRKCLVYEWLIGGGRVLI